jgi:hypothetical protein
VSSTNQMRNRVTSKPAAAAFIIAASLTAPATAHADDPVPSVDQVVAVLAELTDPNIPAANKSDIVTPGFSPDEAGTVDDHLHRTAAVGLLPYNFIVTNIQPKARSSRQSASALSLASVQGDSYYSRPPPDETLTSGRKLLVTNQRA